MVRKKRSATRRRRTKKNSHNVIDNLVGIIISFLMLIGLFRLGIIGQLINGLFAIFVGETNPLAMGIVLIYGLSFTFFAECPKFKTRWLVGGGVAYCGLLMWLQVLLFNKLNIHSNLLAVSWNNIIQSITNADSTINLGGGIIGALLYSGSNYLIGHQGVVILSWIIMLVGVIIFFAIPWRTILTNIGLALAKLPSIINKVMNRVDESVDQIKKERQQKQRTNKKAKIAPAQPVTESSPTIKAPAQPETEPKITVASSNSPQKLEKADAKEQSLEEKNDIELATGVEEDEDYQLPPATLLTEIPSTDQQNDLKAIKTNTKKLQDTLSSFGVDATVENVNLGPSVTKYELRPAVGVKVSKITHLADDLALALAAKDIRIEAPIPGKSLIGIEVPNQQIATVGFRDMVESMPKDDKPMNVPLGRAITGDVMMADLTKMPHLLIAGATGSGKSVAINDIITSILLKAKPHQVKFLMIDPKKVELSVYNGIPHLLSPVVSEPKKAARALAKIVAEMERRYELFAKFGIRNINGYNELARQNNENSGENQPDLPLILVIVDELADLMMTVSHDVEDSIVRIAQMGRAAGIHMILATQRPSVDVITGLIKANVPSRIAFAVSSGIDSRTIIDTNGAEKLLGRGDMLFEPIDQNKPVRIQGAFISDQDVEAVVDFIKQESSAEYDQNMVVTDSEVEEEAQSEEQDSLFNEALEFVVDQQKASTSLIQRRFRIGYNRAARIIDDMEQRGYIGPANGSKPREVYKQKEEAEN
ncbi:DNA translocase FtsK [Lactobacillaceae bacterium 24-114]